MNRLRTRLIVAFLLATVLPLGATVWITTSLIDRSLGFATTGELDRLSRTLEETVRQFYQRERDALKQDVLDRDALDRSKWELAMRVPMRFNRLVLVQPQYWHTAGESFGDTVENGRLVYLMFFKRGGPRR